MCYRWNLIREAYGIFWEELGVANKAAVQAVDALLRQMMKRNLPFGGKKFFGIGDFGQSAPIVKNGGIASTIDASIKSSYLWKYFKSLQLHQPMRQSADPEYGAWIDSIRDGDSEEVSLDLIETSSDKEAAILDLYTDAILRNSRECIKRSYLAVLNKTVDGVNKSILDRLPGEEKTYYSYDSIKEDNDLPPSLQRENLDDYLAMFDEPGVPPHELKLKPGCVCTIMRNLSIDKNLIKNTKVIVRQIYRYSIKVEVLYDDNRPAQRDNQHAISRINFSFNPQGANWTIVRMQFPLRLAYASTFNSCQGLTLDRIWVDFEVQVFAHGQLYTALSRVRRREHIKGLIPEGNQKIVRNVVIKDLITL